MPPRSEEELDPVTLHNQALIGMDASPSDGTFVDMQVQHTKLILEIEFIHIVRVFSKFAGFAKLQYLLSQNPFPPETFSNLLLLYCKYEVLFSLFRALKTFVGG